MRRFALVFAAAAALGAAPQEEARVVVHEWGTFTSLAGADGASLDWRPLAGPSDLPSFVYTVADAPKGLRHGKGVEPCPCASRGDGCKACTVGTIRMETPVLYFYADRETTLSVRVDFPKGRITEWYPAARAVGRSIDWGQIRILPRTRVSFPREKGESHYYPAREADADPVRVCIPQGNPEHEGFLFYRGVGTFDLPLKVTLSGDQVTLRNLGKDALGPVVIFENRNGKIGYRLHDDLKDEVTLDRPDDRHGLESLASELTKILTRQGLYAKEAAAMIKTWRDSWFEPGLRVFYVVPRPMTDALLPVAIEPKPAGLVRVLVGRAEILTPEMEAAIAGHAGRLGDDLIEVRESATKALASYGRFAEPVLRRILEKTADPEVKARIRRLIGG